MKTTRIIWWSVVAILVIVFLSLLGAKDAPAQPDPAMQDVGQPPLMQALNLPYPMPACYDPNDPGNGLDLAIAVAMNFGVLAHEGLFPDELPGGCVLWPQGFPMTAVMRIDLTFDEFVDQNGDEWSLTIYGTTTPAAGGIWFMVVPIPIPEVPEVAS